MSQTATIETKSAQAEAEGYLVRRRDSSYPMGPINSYVQGLRGAASIMNGMPLDRQGLSEVNERRAAMGLPIIKIRNPEQFLPFTPCG